MAYVSYHLVDIVMYGSWSSLFIRSLRFRFLDPPHPRADSHDPPHPRADSHDPPRHWADSHHDPRRTLGGFSYMQHSTAILGLSDIFYPVSKSFGAVCSLNLSPSNWRAATWRKSCSRRPQHCLESWAPTAITCDCFCSWPSWRQRPAARS